MTYQPPSPDSYINHAVSIQYWSSIPPTVNGMLGGFPQISQIDLRGSASFLTKVRRLLGFINHPLKRGLDCGAGIGRVTFGFLVHVCEVVDAVEPVERFAAKLRESSGSSFGKAKLGRVYVVGLEDWDPSREEGEEEEEEEEDKVYDLIWNQWCVGHLTDRQLVDYLQRCKRFLSPSGIIVMKENVSTDPHGQDIFDELDSSVIRTDAKMRSIIKEADFNLIKSEEQMGFPKSLGLFPVRFYALRPA